MRSARVNCRATHKCMRVARKVLRMAAKTDLGACVRPYHAHVPTSCTVFVRSSPHRDGKKGTLFQRPAWNTRQPQEKPSGSAFCCCCCCCLGDGGRARPAKQRSTGSGMRHPNELTPAWQETTPRGGNCIALSASAWQQLSLRAPDSASGPGASSRAPESVWRRVVVCSQPPPLAFSAVATFYLGRQSKSCVCSAEGEEAQPGLSEPPRDNPRWKR